jgi:hypothetical protein
LNGLEVLLEDESRANLIILKTLRSSSSSLDDGEGARVARNRHAIDDGIVSEPEGDGFTSAESNRVGLEARRGYGEEADVEFNTIVDAVVHVNEGETLQVSSSAESGTSGGEGDLGGFSVQSSVFMGENDSRAVDGGGLRSLRETSGGARQLDVGVADRLRESRSGGGSRSGGSSGGGEARRSDDAVATGRNVGGRDGALTLGESEALSVAVNAETRESRRVSEVVRSAVTIAEHDTGQFIGETIDTVHSDVVFITGVDAEVNIDESQALESELGVDDSSTSEGELVLVGGERSDGLSELEGRADVRTHGQSLSKRSSRKDDSSLLRRQLGLLRETSETLRKLRLTSGEGRQASSALRELRLTSETLRHLELTGGDLREAGGTIGGLGLLGQTSEALRHLELTSGDLRETSSAIGSLRLLGQTSSALRKDGLLTLRELRLTSGEGGETGGT